MKKRTLYTITCICIWIAVWIIAARLINKSIFFPSPKEVLIALKDMLTEASYYRTVLNSLLGIGAGFFIGMFGGIVLAIIANINSFTESLISIPVKVIKAIPVASFVILALLWINSSKLSILIASLMVLPVFYTSVFAGIRNTDVKLLQFAMVYRISKFKQIIHIYIPSVFLPLISASKIAAGFAWKSGVAAEIIGLIRDSIGNELYKSKLYLETPRLFAWTITIVIISIIFEKLIVLMLNSINKLVGGDINVK